jgi:hypothetical protein
MGTFIFEILKFLVLSFIISSIVYGISFMLLFRFITKTLSGENYKEPLFHQMWTWKRQRQVLKSYYQLKKKYKDTNDYRKKIFLFQITCIIPYYISIISLSLLLLILIFFILIVLIL